MPASLEDLEAVIREQAEKKIGVAKTLAEARATLVSAREAFARQDAQNLSTFRTALKAARDTGFSARELAALKLTDPDHKPARKPRTRKTAGAPPATQ